MKHDRHYTPGMLAVRIGGVQAHHIVRLIKRGLIPHTRAGRLHLVAEKDVSEVRTALLKAGYLAAVEAAHVG
jgi:hypothetical protein